MGVGGAHIWAWAGSLSAPAGRPARTQRGFEVRRLNAADFTRFTRALYVEGLYVSLGRRSYRLGSVNNGGQWGRADKCCVHAGCERRCVMNPDQGSTAGASVDRRDRT